MNPITKLALAAAASFTLAGTALAEYPEKPISIIVPFSAGGVTDLVVRTIEPALEAELDADIVIRNVTGASGTIAAAEAAAAEADGYTLFFTPKGPVNIQPFMRKLPYESTSFKPIARVNTTAYATLVHKDSPFESFEDLVAHAKENPGELSVASTGVGTLPYLAVVAMSHLEDLKLKHIPFKSSPEVAKAILGGELDSFTEMSHMAEQYDLKTIACWGAQRCTGSPDVPTLQESGYDFVLENWVGFVGPAGLDDAVTQKLSGAIRVALADPEVAAALKNQNITEAYLGHDDFAEVYTADAESNLELLATAGISAAD